MAGSIDWEPGKDPPAAQAQMDGLERLFRYRGGRYPFYRSDAIGLRVVAVE